MDHVRLRPLVLAALTGCMDAPTAPVLRDTAALSTEPTVTAFLWDAEGYAHDASTVASGTWTPRVGKVYVYAILNGGSIDRTVLSVRGNNVNWRVVGSTSAVRGGVYVRQTLVIGVPTASATAGQTRVTLSGRSSADLYLMPMEWTGIDRSNPVAKVVTARSNGTQSITVPLLGPANTAVALTFSVSGNLGALTMSDGMTKAETHYVGTTSDDAAYGLTNVQQPRASWLYTRAVAAVAVALRKAAP